MVRKILGFFSLKDTVSPKDPMDWTLTPSSKEWHTDQYCPQCKEPTSHRERMADICNNCGHHGDMRSYRSYREIWNGKKWVWQVKYGNGTNGYEIKEK